jgi:hypothetical protein
VLEQQGDDTRGEVAGQIELRFVDALGFGGKRGDHDLRRNFLDPL